MYNLLLRTYSLLTTPMISTMTSMTSMMATGPQALAPVSPMALSPAGPLSPPRQITPPRYQSPPKRATPERVLSSSPAVNHPLPSACSPANPPAVAHSSSPAEAPQSSGSGSSSSGSGSDSCSDSSDDSEDEEELSSAQPPAKGLTTPPSVSPKRENLVEEPLPAVEERRWDLSSFFNKTAVQPGEQNSDVKPVQVRSMLLKVARAFDESISTREELWKIRFGLEKIDYKLE